jgi:SAM-dependent methyltransferase
MIGRLKRFYSSHALQSSDAVLLTMCRDLRVDGDGLLLDVGCGSGDTTRRLANACGVRRLFGLEGHLPSAREAARNNVHVSLADFEEELPFGSSAFDLVVLNNVIEHIRNLDRLVAELSRILKPRGQLLIATPNLASWTNIVALVFQQQAFSQSISSRYYLGNRFSRAYRQPVPYGFPQHCHILTSRGIQDLLELNGLRLNRLRGAGYFPFPDVPLARLDPGHAQYLVAHAIKDR